MKDTIRNFLILEDLKIIIPKNDFDVFEKEKNMNTNNRSTSIVKFYRYE